MLISSDGRTRSLVSDIAGTGWDYNLQRHPYHEIERPLSPHYCVYNRRLMACCFDHSSTEDGYWLLRQKAAVLNTGELPLQFAGPDAEMLLNRLFTKDISKLKTGRCAYGLPLYEDGGLITDGVLLRLEDELFWYVQADGDFYSWARAHASRMDVTISDPGVFASQIQGPNALKILAAACDDGIPDPFGYFAMRRVRFGGQEVVITRTGYTNELGFEFYTEPHHDAQALWTHLKNAGEPFGMNIHGLDAMNIRRIEAGILNAGADFDMTTNPYEAGFGRFVDDTAEFIGKAALENGRRALRVTGIACDDGVPFIGGDVATGGKRIGVVTAGVISPFLGHGIGIVRLDAGVPASGTAIEMGCADGRMRTGRIVEMPFYDKAAEIPRGKLIDVPERRAA
ncbi:MAG: aminomethyltransferase family protein [Pseudomonadota bacterium]